MLGRGGRRADYRERDESWTLAYSQRLRSAAEITRQYRASQAFAPVVTNLPPIPHQYSAGQAAALAWLAGHGPAPLTYGSTAAVSGPHSVQRTRHWAEELMAQGDDDIIPRPYVVGVEYVCLWAQRRIDEPPFPHLGKPSVGFASRRNTSGRRRKRASRMFTIRPPREDWYQGGRAAGQATDGQ